MYLDEAGELGKLVRGMPAQGEPAKGEHTPVDMVLQEQKSQLDHFLSALDVLSDQSLFTVLLSTQSKIEHLAPSSAYARSARYRMASNTRHAPLTETPFDCFDSPLVPSSITFEDTSNVVFMSLFGRPL